MHLSMSGITKSFPGVRALNHVDLTLDGGEVLALMGENGAGKSTLIKILGGAQLPDSGSITLDDVPLELTSPSVAERHGMNVIHQELNLVPTMSAVQNLFLGREYTTLGVVDRRAERLKATEVFQRLGCDIPLDATCDELSVGQQQSIEIGRALVKECRILVMDEPTAALSPREVESLFRVIRELREAGLGIIYISHRLDEVSAIADRVAVLRDGENVGERTMDSFRREELIEMMVGRTIDQEFPRVTSSAGEVRLQADKLSRGTAVREVSLSLRAGEIVGLTGLVGAGRTELARLLFGADHADSGTVRVDGTQHSIRSPRQAIRLGICLLTEDRKAEGLIGGQSILENFGLPNMKRFAPAGWVRRREELRAFESCSRRLSIRATGPHQLANTLSGGNQQKVVLAKWLQRNANVIIFDEPTRGIDVGARYEIYLLMNELAAAGKAILMISSDLPEALGMSHRLLVMHEGRIVGEFRDPAAVTQQQVLACAI